MLRMPSVLLPTWDRGSSIRAPSLDGGIVLDAVTSSLYYSSLTHAATSLLSSIVQYTSPREGCQAA